MLIELFLAIATSALIGVTVAAAMND